jgi:hypothetical protein
MIELKASYAGPLDNDKELELFNALKAKAAADYPNLRIGGSRFEVTKDDAGVEQHVHYLTLDDPNPRLVARAPSNATMV